MLVSLGGSQSLQIGKSALNSTTLTHVMGGADANSQTAASADRNKVFVVRRDDYARPGRPFSNLDQSAQTQAQEFRNDNKPAEKVIPISQGDPDEEGADGLTEAERRKVRELQARDRQVREHERAHQVAGGQFASSPTYRTVTGPDGRSYAVGGEVRIDTSVVPNNPEATIRKLQIVKRAALAPQEPSSADRAVASEAEQKILRARAEIQQRKLQEAKEAREKGDAFISRSSSQGVATTPNGEPLFNPEKRFRGEKLGVGEVDTQLLRSTTTIASNGVLGPGQLLSLTA
ncbi:putative metalloprotease CJM1_0395 family protein [Alphaproteobacteria bacterium]|nr:putative metalloprotease CJM1_0395 family protein [Alphaproteobacteria bacterium]